MYWFKKECHPLLGQLWLTDDEIVIIFKAACAFNKIVHQTNVDFLQNINIF